MKLSEATWTAVRDADLAAALLPVGSTEQHGPHAPLGTDALTAEVVADAAAVQWADDRASDTDSYPSDADDSVAGGDLLVAPPVHVGVAEEHRAFDGTLWVSPDTFRAYVRETVESLASHGIDRVVLVNGHGGNVEALAEVARRVSRDDATDAYAVSFTWFEAVGEHASRMGHGGPLETAMVRHVAPDLVREDRVEEARDGGSDRWGEWVRGVNLAHDSDEFTGNGVVGDPTEGTAELGAELLERASDALCDVARAVVDRER
ncbi:creatininase family protein [Halobaculum magnesiiphilum]|uniref:Creatininase family protein n=1 Tax=Halobaculum magnesiiphilum TaxID=1017351 RepID=A0A8T8WBU3_9EURY|nr:creatininase family protein [Halobaculum magnesiiphilum]QZP37214.1 creatininase family protein [Halobaculum magnesiiphilum]